jgi:acetyl-CoA carboxylase, biotin carboxylase subunit
VTPAYCRRCGDPLYARPHPECEDALALEPPRYCPECRRRLVVQVLPAGYRAACPAHGSVY